MKLRTLVTLTVFLAVTTGSACLATELRPSSPSFADQTRSTPKPLLTQQARAESRVGDEQPEDGTKSKAAPDPVSEMKLAIIKLQNESKLGFRKVVACSKVEGFGRYAPLKPGVKASGLMLYFEPANVGTLISKDRYIVDCSVDLFIVQGKSGKLKGKKSVLKLHRVSRSPVLDLFFALRINLKKSAKGTVLLKMVLNDNIKNESASITLKVDPKKRTKPLQKVQAI